MGLSLMPKSVLDTFPERRHISVHPLPRGQDRTRIVLMWRKGTRSPNISALAEILAAVRSPTVRRLRRA
jgi:DNA-binding transcriptional LysR family regulator